MDDTSTVLNGRFKLLHRAGAGGMSTVYKAQDLSLGRIVAIKILHQSLTGDEEFLARFHKEAHAVANLSHPNIVTVHDIGRDGDQYFMVMEYVEGFTLKDVIRQHISTTGRPMPVEISLDITIKICAAVGYAHRADLVHCDVKSQNVLITSNYEVKVTDFGIARAMSETSLSKSDVIWGTPQYFSPEQAAGERPTPASDVYSIGIIMFEMLTGRLPFEAETHTALAVKHLRQPAPRVTEVNPYISVHLSNIVAKVLSKEPSGRYRTADQLGSVLTTYRSARNEQTGPQLKAVKPEANVIDAQTLHHTRRSNLSGESEAGVAWQMAGETQEEEFAEFDRTALLLGLLAAISLLGLIPLWYLVFIRFTG